MKQKLKQILENSFYQLLIVYTLLIISIALGLFWKYALQFQIFALIISLLGISILANKAIKKEELNTKLHRGLFILAILMIILFRTIPYINNSIPLGYDTGIYKYGIEHGLQNLDNWILHGGLEPGFLYLMSFFKLFLPTQIIITLLLTLFCTVLGIAVYLLVKEYSDKKAALIALFIYAFSIAQLKTFELMYYKNIIGMSLILFSLLFLKKYEKTNKNLFAVLFILFGGLVGSIHRPSFYIFGLAFFFYAFISPYKDKKYDRKILLRNILFGILILAIASLFYIGQFSQAVTIMFEPVLTGFIQPGEASGTFINFFTFQFSSLFYLPLALLGAFYFIKKKEYNILVIWAILNFAIVYFQFFFFNRFIIMLDLILIILASFGFSIINKDTKKIGAIIMILLLASAGILAFAESLASKPLVNQDELQTIQALQTTEENAYVMSTSSYYSPWILGYSERKTIAPGLFDYDNKSESDWKIFWKTNNLNEMKNFLLTYQKPLYIFIGERQKDNLAQFNQTDCFSIYTQERNNKIYQYLC